MPPYPKQLVLRVNEIYHDVEEAEYQNRHPEIFRHEAERWQRIAERFIHPRSRPLTLLDIGSGTGFVPLQVSPTLGEGDTLICSDLSANMLAVCRRNLEAQQPACRREYLKLDGEQIPLPAAACDIVTMNSVLHHVPEFPPFLHELDRILAPGGLLIIAHEPNRRFYQHAFLSRNERAAGMLFHPRASGGRLLRRLRLIDLARRLVRRFDPSISAHTRTVDEVNRRLLHEHLIERPLTTDQMTAIVDIQSPTAGGRHQDRGIDVEDLVARFLPGFSLELLETYNHLGDATTSSRTRLARWYDARLRWRYPAFGATLTVVLRKPVAPPSSR